MLFTYAYVPHKLEKLQEWLAHLVNDVWCNPRRHYHSRLLLPEFRQVVWEVSKASRVNDYLWGPIREIHNICRDKLSPEQRASFRKAFYDNINIQALCASCPGIAPVTHKDIAAIDAELAEKLEAFCTNLWQYVRKLKPVSDRVGTLGDHFSEFRKKNQTSFCAFCGIARIEGVFSEIQEDYDHFLPKGTYPFNAVAMRNLTPICDKCNKKFKLQRDPLHGEGAVRRRAFYCYSSAPLNIDIKMSFHPTGGKAINPRILQPEELIVDIQSSGRIEEVNTWKEVFSIESRYKDILCQGHRDGGGGGYWLELVLGEMSEKGYSPTDATAAVKRAASTSRWADANFLKVPFLDACHAAGVIR